LRIFTLHSDPLTPCSPNPLHTPQRHSALYPTLTLSLPRHVLHVATAFSSNGCLYDQTNVPTPLTWDWSLGTTARPLIPSGCTQQWRSYTVSCILTNDKTNHSFQQQ